MSGLSLQDVYKSYGATHAVNGVSFEVEEGQIVALLGPSGCGKSTILALIAGLEQPDRGEICWNSVSLQGTPPSQRGFGLMFQDFALFPHKNVFENVAFGLRMASLPDEQVHQRAREVLELVGLSGFEARDVNTLSGGEQQRVALARSAAPHPRLLMLDEPLGALDRALRDRLLMELGEILRRMQQTAIYVTHDQEEAFALADRVVLMSQGRIEQAGEPQAIYSHPASAFVARFLGLSNLLPGEVLYQDGQLILQTAIGALPAPSPLVGMPAGNVTVLVRPDGVLLDSHTPFRLAGRLVKKSFRGSTCRAVVDVQGTTLTFDFLSNAPLPAVGEPLELGYDPAETLQVFPNP
jgi:ABC-type Fe3+/spermidine/putrescine transport system ATPase subunit